MINADMQNRLADLNNTKNKSERNITPPSMKEIEKVTAEFKNNKPKALQSDYYNNLKNATQGDGTNRNNTSSQDYVGIKTNRNTDDPEDNTQEKFIKNDNQN